MSCSLRNVGRMHFCSLFPNFNANYNNLVQAQFAIIFQVKQISIIAKELDKRENVF